MHPLGTSQHKSKRDHSAHRMSQKVHIFDLKMIEQTTEIFDHGFKVVAFDRRRPTGIAVSPQVRNQDSAPLREIFSDPFKIVPMPRKSMQHQ